MRSFLNKRPYRRRHIALDAALVVAFIAALSLIAFFRWYENTSAAMARENGLKPRAANAIKHAYAGAGVFRSLRSVGIGPDTAEAMTLGLGVLNEYAELWVRSKKDSTAEAAKDMHNNYVGVLLAREDLPLRKAVVHMAHEGIVATEPSSLQMALAEEPPPDLKAARRWFADEKAAIAAKTRAAISRGI